MTNDKILIPLSVAGIVVAVWAALRKPAAIVVQQPALASGNGADTFSFPTIAPLEIVTSDPSTNAGTDAGTGIGTNVTYVQAAQAAPAVQAPVTGGSTPVTQNGTGLQGTPAYPSNYAAALPARFTSQLPPWKNGQLQALAKAGGFTPPASTQATVATGGCGGGCGSSKKRGRCTNVPVAKSLDQANDFLPLYARPAASPTEAGNTAVYGYATHHPNPNSTMGVAPDDHTRQAQ